MSCACALVLMQASIAEKQDRDVHALAPFPAAACRTTLVSSGVKLVSPSSMCPVSRAVISWNIQALPSGSLKVAKEA